MSWLERHPDRAWTRLAAGLLEPAERSRVAQHARTCARCAPKYERAVGVQRVLDGRDAFVPSQDELAQFEQRGLERALAAAGQKPAAPVWSFRLAGALALGLALILVIWSRRPRPAPNDEMQWRGSTAAHAQVRAFCARSGQLMIEVVEGGTCPAGGVLAFAASAPADKAITVLRLSGSGQQIVSDPLTVTGRPGSEHPLDYTQRLDLPPGAATLEVGFGSTAEEARAALHGSGEIRTLHLVVGAGP